VARMGQEECVYGVSVGRHKGKIRLGRRRRRWEDNIKMELRDVRFDGAKWIHLAQGKVQWQACVSTVMNLQVP
jgi:hypothetical protein